MAFDMGNFNQDMFQNSFPNRQNQGGKKKKRLGMIDMVSKVQQKYAAEKNGVPLPAELITTGHTMKYMGDILKVGFIDLLFTFFVMAVGILFLILSKNFYLLKHFSVLNYIIGGFIFSIPGFGYGLYLSSTIKRYYEVNLTNTKKMIRIIFDSFLSIQIVKIFILPVIYFEIFKAISGYKPFYIFCLNKMKTFAGNEKTDKAFFVWEGAYRVLTDHKYRTIEEVAVEILIGVIIALAPPIYFLITKTKSTKNIKNTNVVRGKSVEETKTKNFTHNPKYDPRTTGIFGTNGTGKSTLLDKFIRSRMDYAEKNGTKQKWIFANIKPEFMGWYYREDDLILDVTDERCALWNFLSDMPSPFAIKDLASEIVPVENSASHNRFFTDAASLAIYDALMECFERGDTDNMSVKRQVISQAKPFFERIKELTGNASQSFTDVYQTYRNFIDPILYLNTSGRRFLLKDWLGDPDDDRRIFINYHGDSLTSQSKFLNMFFTTFSNRIIASDFESTGRINIVIDELANLGQLKSLPTTLSLCRYRNVAFFFAAQTPTELKRIYGESFYNLMNNVNNIYVFRLRDGQNAQLVSEIFGKIDKKELSANTAVSTEYDQEHTTTYSSSIRETHIILSGEIQSLPDYNYYAYFTSKDEMILCKTMTEGASPEFINDKSMLYHQSVYNYHAEIKRLEEEILSKIKEEDQAKKEQEKKQRPKSTNAKMKGSKTTFEV